MAYLPPPSPGLLAILATVLLCLWRVNKMGRRPADFPPGPPTLPVLGNLHLVPRKHRHRKFAEWAREYGPVFSLMLGPKPVIVLSSDQAVKDLLDARGAIYSSRPESYIEHDILSNGQRVLLMPLSKDHQKIRKIAHRVLNQNVARAYAPYQDVETKAMLLGFLDSPGQFIQHVQRSVSSLTTQMTFGFRITSEDDPTIRTLFQVFANFAEMVEAPGTLLLNMFPILRLLPDSLLPVRRKAKRFGKLESELFLKLFLDVKRGLAAGTAMPCVLSDLVRMQAEEGYSDVQAGYLSGSLLMASSETTSAILTGFLQAMVMFPGAGRAARAELDRVCGARMPALADMADLPYVRGCLKESYRWMPTVFLGVPHCVTRDDAYMGYRIPRDAMVILNVWAIHTDPARHADPRAFDPTRWAHDAQTSAEAGVNPDASQRDHFVFGAGRRFCQGTHIADASLALAIARILWAFDVGPVPGVQYDAEDLSGGIFIAPNPFPAHIAPRDADKARAVREEWNRVKLELLDEEMQWREAPRGLIW